MERRMAVTIVWIDSWAAVIAVEDLLRDVAEITRMMNWIVNRLHSPGLKEQPLTCESILHEPAVDNREGQRGKKLFLSWMQKKKFELNAEIIQMRFQAALKVKVACSLGSRKFLPSANTMTLSNYMIRYDFEREREVLSLRGRWGAGGPRSARLDAVLCELALPLSFLLLWTFSYLNLRQRLRFCHRFCWSAQLVGHVISRCGRTLLAAGYLGQGHKSESRVSRIGS